MAHKIAGGPPTASPKVEYVLDWKTFFPLFITGGIFLIGFLSLLLLSFNAMLSPIRKDISRLEGDIKANKQELKADIAQVEVDLKADIARVEVDLKADIKALNDKLDRIIVVIAKMEQNSRK